MKKQTYQGNITITSQAQWDEFAKKYDKVTGSIYMQGCTGLTSVTFPDKVTGSIDMDETSSEYLLSLQHNKIVYRINSVQFPRNLFDSVRHGELSAAEVFAISNMEQRRVAYERMDKIKMKDLDGLAVLDEVADDGHGYPMRIVSFNLPRVSEPFLFLNCHCPSGGREYYLETRQEDCWAAKAASFGLVRSVEWVAEY